MLTYDNELRLPPPPAIKANKPSEIQFFNYLKQLVIAGQWKADDFLPTPNDFARHYDLMPSIVQTAFNMLAQECWIVRRDGANYQITPKINQPITHPTGFSELIRARGFIPSSIWLKREICTPDREVQWRLDLDNGEKIARLERIRLANDVVIGYECSSLPASLLPEPQGVEHSLYTSLAANQLTIGRAVEEVGAEMCNPAMAIQCGLTSGQAMLRLTRVAYLADGRPLELTQSYFRSDYYHYEVELNR